MHLITTLFNKADFVKIKQDHSKIEWDQLRDLYFLTHYRPMLI